MPSPPTRVKGTFLNSVLVAAATVLLFGRPATVDAFTHLSRSSIHLPAGLSLPRPTRKISFNTFTHLSRSSIHQPAGLSLPRPTRKISFNTGKTNSIYDPNNIVRSRTDLQMGYNLPPPRGPQNDIKALFMPIATIAGLTLFFISPLGSIFFAVFNSLFLLALVAPLLGWVGLQTWQAFNTVTGACPNCGAPVRTLKDDGGQPSLCINCGSLVRTNQEKNGVELCNDPSDVLGGGNSLFEQLFFGGIGDSFGGVIDSTSSTTSERSTMGSGNVANDSKPAADKVRREKTIIDVDVETD